MPVTDQTDNIDPTGLQIQLSEGGASQTVVAWVQTIWGADAQQRLTKDGTAKQKQFEESFKQAVKSYSLNYPAAQADILDKSWRWSTHDANLMAAYNRDEASAAALIAWIQSVATPTKKDVMDARCWLSPFQNTNQIECNERGALASIANSMELQDGPAHRPTRALGPIWHVRDVGDFKPNPR
jgi:hypothetical protein